MLSWLWPWTGAQARAAPPADAPADAAQAAPPAPVPAPAPAQQEPALPTELLTRRSNAIHLPFSSIFVAAAFSLGFVSGLATGAHRASLVFLAENAHRRPTTVQGWYFYNKTKNYKMILGGARQGVWTGLRLSGWVSAWGLLDIVSAKGRQWAAEQLGREPTPPGALDPWHLGHWTDGLAAGTLTALVGAIACKCCVLTDRIPQPTVPRMLALGAVAGATTGGLRDLRNALLRQDEDL